MTDTNDDKSTTEAANFDMMLRLINGHMNDNRCPSSGCQ